jgi:hypothetical protein
MMFHFISKPNKALKSLISFAGTACRRPLAKSLKGTMAAHYTPEIEHKTTALIQRCFHVPEERAQRLAVAAFSRNKLAHPKARKASEDDSSKHWIRIQETAREAVNAMDAFFREFESIAPDAVHFTPGLPQKPYV